MKTGLGPPYRRIPELRSKQVWLPGESGSAEGWEQASGTRVSLMALPCAAHGLEPGSSVQPDSVN